MFTLVFLFGRLDPRECRNARGPLTDGQAENKKTKPPRGRSIKRAGGLVSYDWEWNFGRLVGGHVLGFIPRMTDRVIYTIELVRFLLLLCAGRLELANHALIILLV